jgi:5,5'-dehydrodivanillate O-demethylase
VLDADSVEWFKQNGGLPRKNGDHFRDTLLSRGGSEDAVTLFKNFSGREPYVQQSIPTWHGPLTDSQGRWIDTHVMNQDFLAWVGQGVIADRSQEHLGLSDRGIVAIRRRFFDELEKIAAGGEAKGTIRDPERNVRLPLPMMDRAQVLDGYPIEEIMAHPRMKLLYTSYIFQAGQPESVRQAFSEAMGLEVKEFDGIVRAHRNKD